MTRSQSIWPFASRSRREKPYLFYNLLAGDYRLIMDLDDKRNKDYGEWYSDHNPLRIEKIKPVTG